MDDFKNYGYETELAVDMNNLISYGVSVTRACRERKPQGGFVNPRKSNAEGIICPCVSERLLVLTFIFTGPDLCFFLIRHHSPIDRNVSSIINSPSPMTTLNTNSR